MTDNLESSFPIESPDEKKFGLVPLNRSYLHEDTSDITTPYQAEKDIISHVEKLTSFSVKELHNFRWKWLSS